MTYEEIVELALSYADRTDTEVVSRMDKFLRIVESRINRKLQTDDMATRSQVTTVADKEYYSLPTDYSGRKDVEIRDTDSATSRKTLVYVSPERLNFLAGEPDRGKIYYTIVAKQMQIIPIQPAGKILEIVYYRKMLPLSETITENWVSIDNPDLYIFGLLVEINAFVKDKEATALWDVRFRETLDEISSDDLNDRWSGTSMQITVE